MGKSHTKAKGGSKEKRYIAKVKTQRGNRK